MNAFTKTPLEYFGYNCFDNSSSAILARKQQYCKFIKSTCVKPRKSEPHIKVGICTVGSTVNRESQVEPVLICPQRFKEDIMFETIRQHYLAKWDNVKWVTEVNLGVGGNIDYVAVELGKNGKINNFLCVEIQAAGTTGSPYGYIKEFLAYGKFINSYTFGINWANEFSKTMMQQAYKKGRIIAHWNRKLVFVLQDLALKYLIKANDCSSLTSYNEILPIDFCCFAASKNIHGNLSLSPHSIYSTSLDGIQQMLGGSPEDEWLTQEDFIKNIWKKGLEDGIFAR